MRILITAGPTREPVDEVRYLGNRSSGRMGFAIVQAALRRGHAVTLVAGPVAFHWPAGITLIQIETTDQMHDAVRKAFASHDLLIMAAAVADFRPVAPARGKLHRGAPVTLELVPTVDILAAVGASKRADQRTVGFSLTPAEDITRAVEKLHRKNLDLIAWNPPATLESNSVSAELFWADGRREALGSRTKAQFADSLLQRSLDLFPSTD